MSTRSPNQLARRVASMKKVPTALQPWLISKLLGSVVPLVGTAGLRFDEITPERVVVSIRNRRPVQNHIKGVHAAAMALLAETATGFCVGMNLPDDKLPLIKTLKVDYLKRASGDMQAVAQLRPEQIQQILTQDKGEVTVPVSITDQSGQSPIQCEMTWAWVPKARKAA
jgi:acyl-coenzyme A thioesterase PaaI-like protein